MNNASSRIKYTRAALSVRRYHQYHVAEVDTVGKHSAGVALFINLIDPHARKELIMGALFHDLGEFVLGDIPAPTKRMLPIESREAMDKVESDTLASYGYSSDLSDLEHILLKLADYCDGLAYCTEELVRGNRSLKVVGEKYISYLPEYMDKIPSDAPWRAEALTVVYSLLNHWKQSQ